MPNDNIEILARMRGAPAQAGTPESDADPANPNAVMSELDRLRSFARWAIQESSFSGCSLDGGEVQDEAEKLGIIIKTKYDPSVHGDNCEAEPGDDCYVFESEAARS